LLANLADGVIVVIGAGTTHYSLVQRVISEIGFERIVGTVLNRVSDETVASNSYLDHYYTPPAVSPVP
jgi:hypothetical protein